jgi:hypothetical protein
MEPLSTLTQSLILALLPEEHPDYYLTDVVDGSSHVFKKISVRSYYLSLDVCVGFFWPISFGETFQDCKYTGSLLAGRWPHGDGLNKNIITLNVKAILLS